MAATETPVWHNKRTDETRRLEELLGTHFEKVEAYRFNSASIRVRIIDSQFEGKPIEEREDLVLPRVQKLPKRIREDILMLLMIAPSELQTLTRQMLVNLEFEDPRASNF
jgi:hypothetical protein